MDLDFVLVVEHGWLCMRAKNDFCFCVSVELYFFVWVVELRSVTVCGIELELISV